MSLRFKIILLFLGLAILPLLLLAGISYWHAQEMLRNTLVGQMQGSASWLSNDFARKTVQIEAELGRLAVHPAYSDPTSASPDDLRVVGDSVLSTASPVFLRLNDGSGRVHWLGGSPPPDSIRCSDFGGSRILELHTRTDGGGNTGDLLAGFWISDLLDSGALTSGRSVQLLKPGTREVLFSSDCQAVSPSASTQPPLGWPPPWDRLLMAESGSLSFQREGDPWLGAFASVGGKGWTFVVSSSPTPVLSSLHRMFLAYWIFVVALAGFTVVAFSMLLRKFTRSLQELSRAAEEIGTGELNPWLPLPTSGEVGQLTIAFSRMLSRIRQMMAKVDQSGRLAVVGQLSAYLAHEIRNPLSSIKLNLQRLRRWARTGSIPEFCLEPVEISLKEVDRLNASVTGVLELSSSPTAPLQAVSVHNLVREAGDLLAGRFRRQHVELTLDLDAAADRVMARPGQVKSVILNLMVNALEAQPKGGGLLIRSVLTRSRESSGPVVALHFKDDGPGVRPAIRDRIFEPFFSTKPGGSGIGLAMASQAVQDCLGELYLEPSLSEEAGAEFVVVLPLAAVEPVEGAGLGSARDPWGGIPRGWHRSSGRDEVLPGSQGDPRAMNAEGLGPASSFPRKEDGGVH